MAEVGRPKIIDEIALQKLESAFANDATDEQACFLANIGTSTLYNYQKEHPEFVERKNALKDMIKYQAKLVVKQALEDDKTKVDTAKWYLERKDKGEFSQRNELTGKDGKDLPMPIIKLDGICTDNSNQPDNNTQQED